MKKPPIHISYSWGNEINSEETIAVESICKALTERGFEYKRDINELKYLDNIRDLIYTIGNGGYVIVIVGEQYLNSENCLLEASYMMLKNESNLNKNIFPIILSDLHGIFNRVPRSEFIENLEIRWRADESKMTEILSKIKLQYGLYPMRKDLEDIVQILNYIGTFINFIGANLQRNFKEHLEENFDSLFKKLNAEIKKDCKENFPNSKSFYKRYTNKYIGRKDSIDKVVNFLNNENEHFFLLCGVGGMGKSHLLDICLSEIETYNIIYKECTKNFHLKELFKLCELDYSNENSLEELHTLFLDTICIENLCIVLDDFYEIIDVEVKSLLPKLISLPAGKILLVSRARPKELENIGQFYNSYFLPPLDKREFKEQLINFIKDKNYSEISDSEFELIFEKANGYPLGGQLILNIMDSGEQLEDILKDLKKFDAEIDPEGKFFSGRLLDNIFNKGDATEIQLLTEFSAFFEAVEKRAIRQLPGFNQSAFLSLLNRRNFIWKVDKNRFGMHAMKKDFAYGKLNNKDFIHKVITDYYIQELNKNNTIKADILNSIIHHLKVCEISEFNSFRKKLEQKFNIKNIKSLIREDVNKTILNYQNLISFYPEKIEYYTELGKAYLKRDNQGDINKAIDIHLKALQIDAYHLHSYTQLGKAYLKRDKDGDIDKAIDKHLKALQIDAHHLHSYTELGKAYLKRNKDGDLDKAIDIHLKALQIDANDLHSYTELGKAYLKRDKSGDIDEAIKTYNAGLVIDKNNLHIRTELGKAYLKRDKQGDLDEAIKTYNAGLVIEKNSLHIRTELGKAYLKRNKDGDIDEAIDIHLKALKIDANDLHTYTELGKAYLKRNKDGDIDKAIDIHLKALKIDANDFHSYTELGKAYLKRNKDGDINKAIDIHLKALEIDANHLHSYSQLGKAYQKRDKPGDIDKAIRTYNTGLVIDKNDLHFNKGLLIIYLFFKPNKLKAKYHLSKVKLNKTELKYFSKFLAQLNKIYLFEIEECSTYRQFIRFLLLYQSYANAIKFLNHLNNIEPNIPGTLLKIGKTLSNQMISEPQKGIEYIKEAIPLFEKLDMNDEEINSIFTLLNTMLINEMYKDLDIALDKYLNKINYLSKYYRFSANCKCEKGENENLIIKDYEKAIDIYENIEELNISINSYIYYLEMNDKEKNKEKINELKRKIAENNV
ncbi:MAG: hypothetical protein GQ564_21775 [Bacteroidales bacterium]|nr:hypothetical protein [Bacteroidales bacterium]